MRIEALRIGNRAQVAAVDAGDAEFRQALARYEMEPAYLSSAAFQTFTVQSMRQEKDILDALGLSKT